jgi:hypothetical protein
MSPAVLALFLAVAGDEGPAPRVLPVPSAGEAVRLPCPVGQTTRLVLPEPLLALRASAGAGALLGVRAEQDRPLGVVTLRPVHPGRGTLEIRGPTVLLTLAVEATAGGDASEIRWLPRAEPSPPTASPTPPAPPSADPPAPAPGPVATAEVPEPSRDRGIDPRTLAGLRLVTIGRREGLPGQRPLTLEDALASGDEAFLRFLLPKGRGRHVERVFLSSGDVPDVAEEPSGPDLRIVVGIPRRALEGRARIRLVVSGESYTFALQEPTLSAFLRGIFR